MMSIYRAAWDATKCESKISHGGWCVLGIEDLPVNLMKAKNLYAHEMQPSEDFGAVDCWYEELFNRTYRQPERGISALDKKFYTELPHVFASLSNKMKLICVYRCATKR